MEIQSVLKIPMGFSLSNRNDLYLCLVAGSSKSSPGFMATDRKRSAILGCWKEAIIHSEHFTVGIRCRGCWPIEPLKESNFKPSKTQTRANSWGKKNLRNYGEKRCIKSHNSPLNMCKNPSYSQKNTEKPTEGRPEYCRHAVLLEAANELTSNFTKAAQNQTVLWNPSHSLPQVCFLPHL